MTFPYPPEPAATVANPFLKSADVLSAATKTTPVDADGVIIIDSAASNAIKRTLWSAVKATLKTYFDTLYFGTSFTKAQLDAAVSDDNVAYLGQSQTFIGNQTITGNVTASGTLAVSGSVKFANGAWNTSADNVNRLLFTASSDSYYNSPGRHVFASGGTETVTISSGGNITASGSIKPGIKTIATLPSAASSTGERYQLSDSATIVNRVAFSNGTAWYYEGTAAAV